MEFDTLRQNVKILRERLVTEKEAGPTEVQLNLFRMLNLSMDKV
jgi:hypothetical protein